MGVQIPTREGANLKAKGAGPCHARTCPPVDILKAIQRGAEPVRCGCRFGCTRWKCTLAPTGEHDWAVRVRRQCGLMSTYFAHLLVLPHSVAHTKRLPQQHAVNKNVPADAAASNLRFLTPQDTCTHTHARTQSTDWSMRPLKWSVTIQYDNGICTAPRRSKMRVL